MRLAMNLDEDEDADAAADDDAAPVWAAAPDDVEDEEEEALVIPLDDPLDGSNDEQPVDSLANLLKYDFISSSVKMVLSFSSTSSLLPPTLDAVVFSKIWSRNDLHATS